MEDYVIRETHDEIGDKFNVVLENIRSEVANLQNHNPKYLTDGIYLIDKHKVLQIIDKHLTGSK